MVGLLELAEADLDDVRQVPAHLREQVATDVAFAAEETMQRILVVARWPLQDVEFLETLLASYAVRQPA